MRLQTLLNRLRQIGIWAAAVFSLLLLTAVLLIPDTLAEMVQDIPSITRILVVVVMYAAIAGVVYFRHRQPMQRTGANKQAERKRPEPQEKKKDKPVQPSLEAAPPAKTERPPTKRDSPKASEKPSFKDEDNPDFWEFLSSNVDQEEKS